MNNLPAHLQGDRRQLAAAAVAGLSAPPVPYISIEGQKFTLVDASGMTMETQTYGPILTQKDQAGNDVPIQGTPIGIYLDAVLVDINENMSKVYYKNAYAGQGAGGTFTPPDCWSDNGVAPSDRANLPQAERCDLCPNNVWGSKVNALGNKVKACDDVKKLAFVIPALNNPAVFLFRLKGSSHRNWSTYIEKVCKHQLGTRPLDPVDVITRIYFEPGQIGIINFTARTLIEAQTAVIQDTIWKAHATDSLVGRLDRPRTGALPAPSLQPPSAAAAPAAVFQPPPMPPQQIAAPSAPPAFAQPAPAAQTQPLQQPSPQGTPAPQRRQRRQTAAAQPQQGNTAPQQPSFAVPAGQPAQPAPAAQPATSVPNFGIQTAGAPTAELEAALAAALAPLPPA